MEIKAGAKSIRELAGKGAAIGGAAVVAASVGFFMFTDSVPTQHHGVQVSSFGGTQEQVLGPGRHIVPPWVSVHSYSTISTAAPYEKTSKMSTNTKDGRAEIDIQAYYDLNIAKLPSTHDRHPDFADKVINYVRVAVRDVGAGYKTVELLDPANRDRIAQEIRAAANGKIKAAGIELDLTSLVIRDVRQPAEIEAQRNATAQQAAEQGAIQAKKDKELAAVEANREVELARIEAQKLVQLRQAASDREVAEAQAATRAAQAAADLAGQKALTPQRLFQLQIEACSKAGSTCIVDLSGGGSSSNRFLNITPAVPRVDPKPAGGAS